jgi:hypothetical protein
MMTQTLVRARLANPDHKLPVPGTQRAFSPAPDGETIDMSDPFWRMLVVDGSLVLVEVAAGDEKEV